MYFILGQVNQSEVIFLTKVLVFLLSPSSSSEWKQYMVMFADLWFQEYMTSHNMKDRVFYQRRWKDYVNTRTSHRITPTGIKAMMLLL
jgi:hypothetical protein